MQCDSVESLLSNVKLAYVEFPWVIRGLLLTHLAQMEWKAYKASPTPPNPPSLLSVYLRISETTKNQI